MIHVNFILSIIDILPGTRHLVKIDKSKLWKKMSIRFRLKPVYQLTQDWEESTSEDGFRPGVFFLFPAGTEVMEGSPLHHRKITCFSL